MLVKKNKIKEYMRKKDIKELREEFYNKHSELKEKIEILEIDTTIASNKFNRIIVKLNCKKHNEEFYAFFEDIVKPGFYGCSQCAEDNRCSISSMKDKALINLKDIVSKNYTDYELVEESFIKMRSAIFLRCKKHRLLFLIYPTKIKLSEVNVTDVVRCPKCAIEYYIESDDSKKRLEEFMDKIRDRFPHFSVIPGKTIYINLMVDIWLHCDKHNIDFQVRPGNLLFHSDRCGCPKCGLEQKSETKRKTMKAQLVNLIKSYDPDIDTSNIVYKTNTTKVKLHCNRCNTDFEKTTCEIQADIKHGDNLCTACRCIQRRKDRVVEVKEKIESVYPGEFDLTNLVYINNSTPITGIKCNRCGKEFHVYYGNFIIGHGCPICSASCGENYVEDWLKDKNIEYKHLYNIDSSVIQGRKPDSGVEIDFMLIYEGKEIWIECNGEQHYTWCKHFHKTRKDFKSQLTRDNNVREYCKDHDILLIEIPWTYYKKDNVWNILDKCILQSVSISDLVNPPKIKYIRVRNKK